MKFENSWKIILIFTAVAAALIYFSWSIANPPSEKNNNQIETKDLSDTEAHQLYILAKSKIAAKDYGAAIEILGTISIFRPNDSVIRFTMGRAYKLANKNEEAIEAFVAFQKLREASLADGLLYASYLDLAYLYIRQDQRVNAEKAIEDLTKIINENTKTDVNEQLKAAGAFVFNATGVRYRKDKRLKDAKWRFEKAISISPNFILAKINLADCYMKMAEEKFRENKIENGRKELAKAREIVAELKRRGNISGLKSVEVGIEALDKKWGI